MLIPLDMLVKKYSLDITGILHCGAFDAAEAPMYESIGVGDVVWVEGNPSLIPALLRIVGPLGHRVISALISDVEEESEFYITNNGESSSLLELGTHKETSPQVHVVETIKLPTKRLDTLFEECGLSGLNFLNLDLQGVEGSAIESLGDKLDNFQYIYSEVNRSEVYKGCTQIEELDKLLEDYTRIETLWCTDGGKNHNWGDAVWVKDV